MSANNGEATKELAASDKEYLEFIRTNQSYFDSSAEIEKEKLDKLRSLLQDTTNEISSQDIKTGYEILVGNMSMQILDLSSQKENLEEDVEFWKSSSSNYEEQNKLLTEQVKLAAQTSEKSSENDKDLIIQDLTNRIELMKKQNDTDAEKGADLLITQEAKISEFQKEIDDLKNKIKLQEIENTSNIRQFAEALNADTKNSAAEIISEFREFLGIKETNETIKEKIRELFKDTEELRKITEEFGIKESEESIIEQLKERINAAKDDLRERITSVFGVEGTTEEIINHFNEMAEQAVEIHTKENEDETMNSPIKESHENEELLEERKHSAELEERLLELEEKIRDKDVELLNIEKQHAQAQTDLSQRIDELTTAKAENITTKKALEEALEKLQNASGNSGDMQDQINALTENKSILTKRNEKMSKRINELEEQIAAETETKSQLDSQLAEAQLKIEKLEYQLEDLSNRQEADIEQSNEHAQNEPVAQDNHLIEAVELITNQIHDQSEELSSEIENRMLLITAVRKQQKIIEFLEKRQQELESKIEQQQLENEEDRTSESIITELIKEITKLEEHKETEKYATNIQKTIAESKSTNENISNAIKLLVDGLVELSTTTGRTDSELAVTNGRLLGFLHSEISFIQSIISDNIEAEENKEQEDPKRQRSVQILMENVTQCNEFIDENCSGITEENFLFEFLDEDCDPMKLAETCERITSAYPNPEESDPKELFAALCQAVAVNSLLRRFASERHQQCAIQATEIKSIKMQSQSVQQELVQKYEEQVSKLNKTIEEETTRREEAENAVQSTLNVLRSHVDDPQSSRAVLQAIEQGSKCAVNKDDYTNELEAKLEKTLAELEMSKKELEESKEQTQMQFTELEEDRTKQLEKIEKENNQLKQTNQELEENTQKLTSELEQLKEENDQMSTNLEFMTKKKQDAENQLELTRNEAEKRIKENEEQAAIKYEKKEQLIKENAKAKKQIIKEDLRIKEAELKRCKDQCSEKDRRIQALEMFKNEMLADQRKKAAEFRKNELESIKSMKALQKELADAVSRANAAELDNKLTKCRLKSVEEHAAREKSKYESQITLQTISQESILRQKEESIRKAAEDEDRQFLVNICHWFKDYADFSQPISRESVSELLKRVQAAMNEISENAASNAPGNISKIVGRLRETQKALESWQSWAKQLCSQEGTDKELMENISSLQESALLAK